MTTEENRIIEGMLEKALEIKAPYLIKGEERVVIVLDPREKDQRRIYEVVKSYERNHRLNGGVTRT